MNQSAKIVFDSEDDFHTGCQNVFHNQQQSSHDYTNRDDQPITNNGPKTATV